MKKIVLFLFVATFMVFQQANAQKISIGGQLGWTVPNGEAFNYDEDSGIKGGIGYTADILYHFPILDQKLAAGLVYNGSAIFGGGTKGGSFDLDLYGLALYGVKGQYRFFKSKVSPYVSISTGLSHLETPTFYNEDGSVAVKGKNSFSFGFAPEFGLELGSFTMSAMYFTPMKYKVWATEKESAGTLQISLGYRYSFDLK
jgi:hypothetical protein